ncbi:MAG: hypothetical protein ABH828_02370 [archaeon]
MVVVEETITTSVDTLIDLLNQVDKIELEKAAKKLGLSISVVQSWVDFLVEENIIGLEYKFTTPYIYLNKPKKKEEAIVETDNQTIDVFKTDFQKKAFDKKIPEEQAHDLWKNHLLQKMEKKKEFFFREANRKGFFNPQDLWLEYKERLMEL